MKKETSSRREVLRQPVNGTQIQSLNRRLHEWARKLRDETVALYFALQHSQTPFYAKIFIAIVVGYAFSPIDMIPDFIPVLGYLDDVIILPLGIALAIKLIPTSVLDACRKEAAKKPLAIYPRIWVAAVVIILLWALIILALYRIFAE